MPGKGACAKKIFLLGIILFIVPPRASSVLGQTTPASPDLSSTTIGSEDTITVVALGADEISKSWRVSSTGDLTLPLVGRIHASGKTTEQLEKELTEKLATYIRDPAVTVYISEFRSGTVTIEGAVEKPGRFQTEGKKTLLGVLMMAGGVKSPGPTLKVTRAAKYGPIPLPGSRRALVGGTTSIEISITDALDASTPAANLIMEPEDVVSVSILQRLVYILGEVNRGGAVELVTQDSVSIVQVLAAAGGLTKVASPGKTTILRKDSEGRYSPMGSVDLKRIMTGKGPDKLLLAGDIVIVPSSNVKYYLQSALLSAATGGVTTSFMILSRF
jgi:polysaccharide export outer membrane protein